MATKHAIAVFVLAVIAALFFLLRDPVPEATMTSPAETPPVNEGPPNDDSPVAPEPQTSADMASPDAERCLTPWQLETHPALMADAGRMESVAISGQTMEAYRHQTRENLESLANQGDSAAMAVLGAAHFLQARGLNDVDPVSMLVHDDSAQHSFRDPDVEDPEVFYHLGLAREWFYRAALNGRLLALHRVGEIDGIMLGGPVSLGWIGDDDYEKLERADKGALHPYNVYNLLAWQIAPQLRDGAPGVFYELIPRRDIQGPILEALAERFERDRVAAKLPPIDVPESTVSIKALSELVCDEYKRDD